MKSITLKRYGTKIRILKRHNAKSWKFEYDTEEGEYIYKTKKYIYALFIAEIVAWQGDLFAWVGKRPIEDGKAYWLDVTKRVKAKSVKRAGCTIVFDLRSK